ncbi:MAG TPA: molybdopterin-dependent oxidoreductase [Longimicrobiales bacterium]|nr:molybdopterin-dependent oxidoreductase [Longimicrobiales bacterium]
MSTDRRTFVIRVAATAGAAAAASLVPGSGVGAGVGRYLGELGLTWRKAPCNLCGVGCGLVIGLEGGRAVAVRGDPDSPVSRGLACVKGYHAVQALYGRDRITRARVRRGGRMVEVPLDEALDLVAGRLRETRSEHGKDSVAMYGSGHWSIPAGYVASKLFKGALGTNNLEADSRLSSGSARAGLVTSFGLDQPMGCYEDIDHADVFVLWDANLAEIHPVLFSRMIGRRRERAGIRIVDLATRTTRTGYGSDRAFLFTPRTDLAIANAICHEIIDRGRANRNFIDRHVAFRKGRTGIGHGLRDDAPFSDDPADATFDEYVRFLADYTPERVERIAGLAAADIRWIASLYADPGLRVMSVWDAGVGGHARGTWMNNLLYNIHLLVGKVATPGNGPLSLAAESSASGSVRDAGTLADALPRGTVTSAADRERAAGIWGVPVGNIDPVPGPAAVSMFRGLDRGDIRFLWIQGANPLVTLPNLGRYRAAAAKDGRFLVVSDAYPTPTTDAADVVLPAALWIEQEGLFGNSERRTQHFEQMLAPPGDAMSDAWQTIEVARRLGFGALFPWDQASHVAGIWTEYARFRDDPARRLPPLAELRARPGVLWPHVDGRETKRRYATAADPAADAARGDYDFYGNPDHRAWIWLRPYEAPAEVPDADFPLRLTTGGVLEHADAGTLTRRIPTLHRAVPRSYVEVNREDAERIGVRDGDTVRVVSRRGSLVLEARVDHRAQPPRGLVFVPVFDEALLVHALAPDAFCPLSGQPDYACAVRIEPVGGAPRR